MPALSRAVGRQVFTYRRRLSGVSRWGRTAILVLAGVVFVEGLVGSHGDLTWRGLSLVGLWSVVWGLRVLHGPAVRVRGHDMVVGSAWPRRRRIPWYRIFGVEVVPGTWHLVVELNSGEHLELPCVEHVDDLYERIADACAELGS